jgi:hypothetical protein
MLDIIDTFAPLSSSIAVTNYIELRPTLQPFSGSTNTFRGFFYNPIFAPTQSVVTHRAIETTTGDILFQSGSTPLFFVSGSGNVGIGTTNPTFRLDVSGSARLTSGSQLRIDDSTGGNYTRIQNRVIAFSRNNGTSEAATINGSSDNQITIYARSGVTLSGGASGVNVMVINDEGGAAGNASVLITGTSTGPNSGSLQVRNSINTQVFKTFDGGSVAVGTITAPTARFQVRGAGATSSTTALLVENSNSSASLVVLDNNFVGLGKSPSFPIDVAITNGGNSNSALYASGVHPDGRCILYGRANTNVEQLLYWWHSGGIGIGTGGGPRGGAVSYVGDRSFYGPGHDMYFMETATTFGPNNVKYRLGIATTTTNTSFASGVTNNLTNIESNTFTYTARSHTFFTGTTTGSQALPNQFTPLHLSNSGSVGIGTTTPNARLDVSGSAIISGSLTVTQTITGSIFTPISGTFVLPLTSSVGPNIPTGSAYWSGSFLFIWDGVQYRSSSFS